MNGLIAFPRHTAVSALSAASLASALDQSVDCVKLVSLDGKIEYMNSNGLCALEIDDFCSVQGTAWADMWPADARQTIIDSFPEAAAGKTVQFCAYSPTAKGTPRWWDVTVSPVTNDLGALAGFLAVSRDVTANHNSQDALRIAAAEMKHRLKNTYQTIASLMIMVARGNSVQEGFAREMADRLGALSRAQSLFTDDEAPCDLEILIPALVTPFGNDACPIAFDAMPAVRIAQSQADAIALVIGELAVNSAKHGAFIFGGAINVSAVIQGGTVAIAWRERCDRKIERHAREGGQGLKLMAQIMRARQGTIVLNWEDHGVLATLAFELPV